MIKVYTDGSCLENPGKGGWAAIIVNDNKMFHSVSPIKLNKINKEVKTGYRDIFVFTTIS